MEHSAEQSGKTPTTLTTENSTTINSADQAADQAIDSQVIKSELPAIAQPSPPPQAIASHTATDTTRAQQWPSSVIDPAATERSPSWTIQDSEELYLINGWGEPYFSINEAGHVTVSPKGDRGGCIDLFDLVNDCANGGWTANAVALFGYSGGSN
jgi:hypothetical protein